MNHRLMRRRDETLISVAADYEFTTFTYHALPPIICYFIRAVLAITPNTRTIRIVLCPVVVLLALRAALPMDPVSLKNTEREPRHKLACVMFAITTRVLGWAFAKEPLMPLTLLQNLRGYGWEWSRGVYIPRETRPSDRTGLVLYTILSTATHAFIHSVLHTVIRSSLRRQVLDESLPFYHMPISVFFGPVGLGAISSGSIFDESLTFYLRFLRSSIITILSVIWMYAEIQTCYHLCTIIGVLVLGQDPTEWPPLFDASWRSTSVTDFWGRRWHQLLRHIFLIQAGYPLSFIFGRSGIVIGVFFASAVFHHITLLPLRGKSEFWRMLVGYGIMALAIIVEQLFQHCTGRKIRGTAGWLWTFICVLLGGSCDI